MNINKTRRSHRITGLVYISHQVYMVAVLQIYTHNTHHSVTHVHWFVKQA